MAMKERVTPTGDPPGWRAEQDLIAALHELGREADDIRESLRGVNDIVYGGKIEHALAVTGKLLAMHLPEPNQRVVHALLVLYRAIRNLRPPPEDEALETRTETRKTIRAGVGRLRMALDEAWDAAKRAYPGAEPIPLIRKRIAAQADKEQVAAFLTELDAFQAAVNDVAREEDTASDFAQQGKLVTFYVRDMTFEIDLARLHLTVNETTLDLGALVNTIEAVRDVTDRFRANVTEWVGRVTDGLVAGTETLSGAVRRLVTGIRALGGMIDDDGGPDGGEPEMVLIQPGSFTMGIPDAESKREKTQDWDRHARPQHRVTIRRPFLLGKYPVTRGEYAEFARETKREWQKPEFDQTDRHPAVNVSFEDAVAYAAWLSKRTGHRYRLPREAEWEYACRAGTEAARYWGERPDRKRANLEGKGTTEVGVYQPNPWGLHDMLGNVWEWVEDAWHETYDGAPADGTAWISDGDPGRRVLRGGSWDIGLGGCRAGYRVWFRTAVRLDVAGFRLARTL